jgi:hypothetical protein
VYIIAGKDIGVHIEHGFDFEIHILATGYHFELYKTLCKRALYVRKLIGP